MPDPIISIDPISNVDVILIQEDSITNQGVTGSIVSSEIMIAGSQETITIKPILPDNIITVCCDEGSTSEPVQDALSAKILILEKVASENISALKLVYLDTSLSVSLANNTSEPEGTVIGMAITSATAGNIVKILVFGIVEDGFFNYNINERLFLGINGEITVTQPSSGVLTSIGFGLGTGAIQVQVDKPVLL